MMKKQILIIIHLVFFILPLITKAQKEVIFQKDFQLYQLQRMKDDTNKINAYINLSWLVNTAARMEQNSEPGKINVSEKTYELVKNKFAFTYRGEIEAKNKGALKMYFVES